MTNVEAELLEALRLLEVAAAPSGTPGLRSGFREALDRVNGLIGRLPDTAAPELIHYLQKRSYEKARLHLEGQAAGRGNCGR